MAKIGNYTKQPVEKVDYFIDYSKWLTTGDDIQSATATATPAGLTVDPPFTTATGVRVWVSGGVNGTSYAIEVTTTTADGRIKQDEFTVKVKEI